MTTPALAFLTAWHSLGERSYGQGYGVGSATYLAIVTGETDGGGVGGGLSCVLLAAAPEG